MIIESYIEKVRVMSKSRHTQAMRTQGARLKASASLRPFYRLHIFDVAVKKATNFQAPGSRISSYVAEYVANLLHSDPL